MPKKKNTTLWVFWIIFTVLILSSLGYISFANTPFYIIGSSSSYQTTRSCNNFMNNIGNPSMNLPFDWRYTSTQYKCITSFTKINTRVTPDGCKITYTQGQCSIPEQPISNLNYKRVYSKWGVECDEWLNNNKINSLCWDNTKNLINLEQQIDNKRTNNQDRCIITYQTGCSQRKQCELVHGSGSSSNRNIFILADNKLVPLQLLTASQTVYTIKNEYPFKKYSNNFNVYRITNSSLFNTDLLSGFLDRNNTYSSLCNQKYDGDAFILSQSNPKRCSSSWVGCQYFIAVFSALISIIDIDSSAPPEAYAHELMHAGDAIGESYGDNPQMFTNASVNNVINWILKRGDTM